MRRQDPPAQGHYKPSSTISANRTTELPDISERTRADYIKQIKTIEAKFGDFPLSALSDRRTRGVFKEWRDQLAIKSGRRQADYAWVVLARVSRWPRTRGKIADNPCEKGGRLYGGSRVDNIWRRREARSSSGAHAPASAADPRPMDRPTTRRFVAAAMVGLRRDSYPTAGNRKGGARVVVTVGAPFKAALDTAAK